MTRLVLWNEILKWNKSLSDTVIISFGRCLHFSCSDWIKFEAVGSTDQCKHKGLQEETSNSFFIFWIQYNINGVLGSIDNKPLSYYSKSWYKIHLYPLRFQKTYHLLKNSALFITSVITKIHAWIEEWKYSHSILRNNRNCFYWLFFVIMNNMIQVNNNTFW